MLLQRVEPHAGDESLGTVAEEDATVPALHDPRRELEAHGQHDGGQVAFLEVRTTDSCAPHRPPEDEVPVPRCRHQELVETDRQVLGTEHGHFVWKDHCPQHRAPNWKLVHVTVNLEEQAVGHAHVHGQPEDCLAT